MKLEQANTIVKTVVGEAAAPAPALATAGLGDGPP